MASWESELETAVRNNNTTAFRKILSRPEVTSMGRIEWAWWGEAPFHYAAYYGRDDMICTLVRSGVGVNSYVSNGAGVRCTALHLAARYGHESTVGLLLDLGANAKVEGVFEDCSGTPLEWARMAGHLGVVKILEERNITVTVKDVRLRQLTEKELNDALDIQEKLNRKLNRLESLEEETKRVESEKATLKTELAAFKLHPCFRSESQIEKLSRKLDQIRTLSDELREKSTDGQECPVCYERPKMVFNCVECENWVCGECKGILARCPICRRDFGLSPLRRNRTVERVLGI